MHDREKVIKGLECCTKGNVCVSECPYFGDVQMIDGKCITMLQADALAMLKEQKDEKKRIMKVIWDTLHEGLSIDTVADQDWVYERIRHRIEDT